MDAVRLTAERVAALDAWSVGGPDFAALTVSDEPFSYALDWQDGGVIATQGDAYVHVDRLGTIKRCVPPCAGLS